MAKEVIANKEQLIQVAKAHLKIYDETVGRCKPGSTDLYSLYLLKFYAVECGIKAMYLKKHSLRDTKQFEIVFPKQKYGHSHNIYKWVKDLKIPASTLNSYKDDEDYPIKDFHETMRYGASIPSHHLSNQLSYLNALVDILKSERIL